MTATITTSPRNTQTPRPDAGHEAADHRPDRDRGGRDPADEPVRKGTILAFIVLRDEGSDGWDHEDGAQALDERPAEEQDRRFGLIAVMKEPVA